MENKKNKLKKEIAEIKQYIEMNKKRLQKTIKTIYNI